MFVSDIRDDWIPALVDAAHEEVRCLMRFSRGRLTVDRGAAKGAWVDRDVGFPCRSPWMRHRPFGAWVLQHVNTKHVAVVGCPPDAYPALCFAEDGADSVWADCESSAESRRGGAESSPASSSSVRFGHPPPQLVDVVLAWDPPNEDINLHPDGIALVIGNIGFLRSLGMPAAVLAGGEIGIATHNSRIINDAVANFGFVKI